MNGCALTIAALALAAWCVLHGAGCEAQACGDDEAWLACVIDCRGDAACRRACDRQHRPPADLPRLSSEWGKSGRRERSEKSTGIDYWLRVQEGAGDEDFLFQGARLEVTGISSGPSQINGKINRKLGQARKSDDSGLQVIIVAVEFSLPLSKLVVSS